MLTSRGRWARGLGTTLVLTLVMAGTLWGDDDHFPFGPFKMYAGTARIDDPVHKMQFEGVTEDGTEVPVVAAQFGLRPAEVEGQLARVVEDPSLLQPLVEAYEERNPDAPRLVEFRVVHGTYRLQDRRPVGYVEEVLAVWRRGSA